MKLISGITLVIAAVAILVIGLVARFDSVDERMWPVTQGQILRSSTSHFGRVAAGEMIHHDIFSAHYQYFVGGNAFQSDIVARGQRDVDCGFDAEDYLKQWPKGAVATVHYVPANPADAVLIATSPTSYLVNYLLLSGLSLWIGIAILQHD